MHGNAECITNQNMMVGPLATACTLDLLLHVGSVLSATVHHMHAACQTSLDTSHPTPLEHFASRLTVRMPSIVQQHCTEKVACVDLIGQGRGG